MDLGNCCVTDHAVPTNQGNGFPCGNATFKGNTDTRPLDTVSQLQSIHQLQVHSLGERDTCKLRSGRWLYLVDSL